MRRARQSWRLLHDDFHCYIVSQLTQGISIVYLRIRLLALLLLLLLMKRLRIIECGIRSLRVGCC